MNRRLFLRQIAAASAAVGMSSTVGEAFTQSCRYSFPPGVQLWTVRSLMAENPRETLAALGTLGIEEVQMTGLNGSANFTSQTYGLGPSAFQNALANAGLDVVSAHINGNWIEVDGYAELANLLDIRSLIVGLPDEFIDIQGGEFNLAPAKSITQLSRLAESLNTAGEGFRRHGLQFGYHNHHIEFVQVDGVVPYYFLMKNTDPDLVKIEFDVAWLMAAGKDPITELRRYDRRVVACHLKDFNSNAKIPDKPRFLELVNNAIAEPGGGTIDFGPILETINELGIAHAFIENDRPSDPLESVARGYRHLQSVAAC